MILDEVGFVRLRDRKLHVLRQDSVLWRGESLHLSTSAVSLRHDLGITETLAPFARTSSGLVYLEHPFVIVGGDEPGVGLEPKPKPRYLYARAKPPKPVDEPHELGRR